MLAKGKKHRKADLNQDEKYCINEFRKFYTSHVTIPELLPTEFRTPDVSIIVSKVLLVDRETLFQIRRMR